MLSMLCSPLSATVPLMSLSCPSLSSYLALYLSLYPSVSLSIPVSVFSNLFSHCSRLCLPIYALFSFLFCSLLLRPFSPMPLPGSTLAGLWIWKNDGGIYFGVPLLNFFGWFLSSFFIVFAYLVA